MILVYASVLTLLFGSLVVSGSSMTGKVLDKKHFAFGWRTVSVKNAGHYSSHLMKWETSHDDCEANGYQMVISDQGQKWLMTELRISNANTFPTRNVDFEMMTSESTNCLAQNTSWTRLMARVVYNEVAVKDEAIIAEISAEARGVFPCYAVKIGKCIGPIKAYIAKENGKNSFSHD